MYCGGVYDEVDVVCDVFRFLGLAIVDVCAAFFEVLGQGRAVPVGAGYGKALGLKNFGEAGHADAADADKINVNWMVKIYLIHKESPFLNWNTVLGQL